MTKLPQVIKQEEFRPSRMQQLIKARVQSALNDRVGLVDADSVTLEELEAWSGSRQLRKWMEDPTFATWLLDRDVFKHQVQAVQESALETLRILMLDEDTATKDRIKAAELLLNLGGAFPSRTQRVVFADAEVGKMSDQELDRELAKYKKQLTASGGGDPERG